MMGGLQIWYALPMRSICRFALVIIGLWAAMLAPAQDAQSALAASVGYNTQRLSMKLSPEQATEAARLGTEAVRATQAGKFGDSLRLYAQGTATMRGMDWSPELELVSGLRAKLDHALVAPGTITVTMTPLYSGPRSAEARLKASVFLARQGQEAINLQPEATLNAATPFTAAVNIPPVASGDYNVEVRFAPVAGSLTPEARAAFTKVVPVHVEASLATEMKKLKDTLAKLGGNTSPALPSAQYALALYERADQGEVNPRAYNFHNEFTAAQTVADALGAGKDAYAGRRGDFHRAYRSKVDNSLQPYRLFVPEAYDPTKPTSLVVALHGMGGDENSMFDQYGKELPLDAQKHGFLVVAPKGLGVASMYRGAAEQDVMDVLAEVRRDYKVDPSRIYLMGHSMGGYGTWSVAMSHPEVFAALAPISGGGDPAGMAKLRAIPQYVTHGDDDKTVNVSQSRIRPTAPSFQRGQAASARAVVASAATNRLSPLSRSTR